jgi:hypothetical protein
MIDLTRQKPGSQVIKTDLVFLFNDKACPPERLPEDDYYKYATKWDEKVKALFTKMVKGEIGPKTWVL